MILGISLDENFVYVNAYGDKNVSSYPFAIGRNLATNSWFIGDDTKNENTDNSDIIVDKLYYLIGNNGEARIGENLYKAEELLKIFFSNLLIKYGNIEYVTVVIRNGNVTYLEKIKNVLFAFFKDSNNYKVTTYSEAFVSFIKSNDPKFYANHVSLFDFTEKALTYYELTRYIDDNNIEYWKVDTKEHLALPLDLLSGDAGKKVCDNLLYDFSKRCIKDEQYSNIILSGLGFEDSSYYREFMTYVCSVANVKTDVDFFAKSAANLSYDFLNNNFREDVVLITDARTTAAIRMNAYYNQSPSKIELIKPGEEWFDIKNNVFNIIIDDEREIKLEILKIIERVSTEISIAIPENVVLRKDRTNLFEINFTFSQQNILQVNLTDKGFGEFFESSNITFNKPIEI